MTEPSDRHLRKMYDRDLVRWKQGRAPMPILSDYVGKPRSESCLLLIAKFVGLVMLAAIGSALVGFFAFYVLMRMFVG